MEAHGFERVFRTIFFGGSMTKLNFCKKFLILFSLAVLTVQPTLAEPVIEFEIQLPKESYGLSFTEFDRFKCYNGSGYVDENLLDPPHFNRDNYKNLSIFLREKLNDLVEDEHYDFMNYTLYGGPDGPDILFDITDDKGEVYKFRTEGGYWWALSRDIEGFDFYNSESLEQIAIEHSRTHNNFLPIIRSVEWAMKQFLSTQKLIGGGFCEMESYAGDQNLLHLTNIYLSNTYFDEVGCEYSEGSLYADCSDSRLYQSINKSWDFWNFKDSETQLTYKSGNNFIFLDRSDISFVEGQKKANTLGFMVVISQSDFFEGFGTGQTIFVDDYVGHLSYLRTLDEVYRNTQKIKSLNEVLNEKIIELSVKKQELNDIFRSSDDLESKYNKLKNFPDFNTSFINENRKVLVSHETYYGEKSALRNSVEDKYFGVYYQEISQDYFEDLNLEIQNLKSNLEYLERRNDVYTESHINLLVNIQSQLDALRNQRFSNLSLIATLLFAIIVLFVSLSMNLLVDISNKYSQRIIEIVEKKILGVLLLTFIVVILILALTLRFGFRVEVLGGMVLYIFIFLFLGFRSITDFLDYERVLEIIKEKDEEYINKIEASPSKSDENDLMGQFLDESILEDIKFKLKFSLENIEQMYFLEIFDILYKSVKDNNTIHTKKGLDTLIEIVECYVDSRKDRKIAQDDFIEYVYQKLIALANISINKEDVFITNDIIKAIETVGVKTLEFEPISLQFVDNATLGAIYHLGDLGVSSSGKLPDSVKQSLISIGNIGKLGTLKWQRSSIAPHTIDKILSHNHDWFTYYYGVSALISITNEEIKNRVNEVQISMDLKKLTKICSLSFDLKIAHNSLIGPLFGVGEVSLHKIVENLVGLLKVGFPEIETHGREKYIKSILKEIIGLFRKLKEKSFETKDYQLAISMDEELKKIIDILSEEKLKTYADNFSKEIEELEKVKIGQLS